MTERAFLVVKRDIWGHAWATKHWSLNSAIKALHKRSDPLNFYGVFRRDPSLDLAQCELPMWAQALKDRQHASVPYFRVKGTGVPVAYESENYQ